MFTRLKEEMEKKGMKGYSLAKKAHIATPDFYNAINGVKPMYPSWRKRIAEVLGLPESDLFEEGDADEH